MSKPASPPSHKSVSTLGWIMGLVRGAPRHTLGILAFSLAVNLLLLVSPLYMLQIYDRVLSSGSGDTLIWLSIIAVFLLGIYAAAEAGRRRVMAMMGQQFEVRFAPRLFKRFESGTDPAIALPSDVANLSRVEAVLQSGTLLAFFDLPFAPLFLGLLFLLNPWLGVLGLCGAALVFIVAVTTEYATRRPGQSAAAANNYAQNLAVGIARQRSAMVAMGITTRLYERWRAARDAASQHALEAAKGDGAFSGISRSLRQILQVLVLGAGAALALNQQISPGGIVAGSIILSRALAPIDQIVGGWRTIVTARAAWSDLAARLDASFEDKAYTPLPKPDALLTLDRLAIGVPGSETPLIRPFTYDVPGGRMLTIAGGNGTGKTSLLQTLAGAWPAAGGTAALGGRNLHAWPSVDRGSHVGYVPQDVELTPGTVAENISRFLEDRLEDVFSAARSAGAHDMIVSLPQGYDTPIGGAVGGVHLSAGQRQLVGLARAFFGNPVLLLLDEPTANLDAKTAEAVIRALVDRARVGGIIIAATHDVRLIHASEVALVLRKGAVTTLPGREYGMASNVVAGPGKSVGAVT